MEHTRYREESEMGRAEAPTAEQLNVGERIFMWRDAKGWSQDELARRSGVSRSAIATAETGRRHPRISTLRRIAWTMGVTVEDLLHGPIPEREEQK